MAHDDNYAEAIRGASPLKPYVVRSDLGTRVWHAENARHACEQHEDAFPEEPVLVLWRRTFHLTTYHLDVLSEEPIPEGLDLREVLRRLTVARTSPATRSPADSRSIPGAARSSCASSAANRCSSNWTCSVRRRHSTLGRGGCREQRMGSCGAPCVRL